MFLHVAPFYFLCFRILAGTRTLCPVCVCSFKQKAKLQKAAMECVCSDELHIRALVASSCDDVNVCEIGALYQVCQFTEQLLSMSESST